MKASFVDKWGGAIGLCLTIGLLSYTVGVVPPIMPPIVRELDSSMGYVQTALVLMSLVTASFIPTVENLSYRFGRRLVFTAALISYSIGLGLIITSPNMVTFILGLSALIGLSAAALMGIPATLLDQYSKNKSHPGYLLAMSISGLVGTLVGSIFGGFLAFEFSWRWAFGFELLCIPVIWLLVRRIEASQQTAHHDIPIDWIGGLLSLAGLGFTLVGISLSSVYGWWTPKQVSLGQGFLVTPFGISIVPVLIAAGVICLGTLVFWQRRLALQGKRTLLRMGVFSRRGYIIGLTIGTLHILVLSGLKFNLFQFIPFAMEFNSFQTALTVMSTTMAQLVVLIALLKYRNQLRPRYVLQFGLALESIGIAMLYPALSSNKNFIGLLIPLIIIGIGTGLFMLFITSVTFSAAAEAEKAEARWIYRPCQQLGQSLGRGIFGTVLVTLVSIEVVDGIIARLGESYSDEVRVNAIQTLQRAIQTFTTDERSALFSTLPEQVQPSLDTIANVAATEAMQIATAIIFGLSLVCFGLSFLLPKRITQFEAVIE